MQWTTGPEEQWRPCFLSMRLVSKLAVHQFLLLFYLEVLMQADYRFINSIEIPIVDYMIPLE